jgi:hypothetical protein
MINVNNMNINIKYDGLLYDLHEINIEKINKYKRIEIIKEIDLYNMLTNKFNLKLQITDK